jgi:hypothetical protein
VSAFGGWFSWSVGGDGVVGSGDERVVWRGMCDADMCDLFSAIAGVATSLSFTFNPPTTNCHIVCHRKDRGGCGCSRRWPWCFIFCLIGGIPP